MPDVHVVHASHSTSCSRQARHHLGCMTMLDIAMHQVSLFSSNSILPAIAKGLHSCCCLNYNRMACMPLHAYSHRLACRHVPLARHNAAVRMSKIPHCSHGPIVTLVRRTIHCAMPCSKPDNQRQPVPIDIHHRHLRPHAATLIISQVCSTFLIRHAAAKGQ